MNTAVEITEHGDVVSIQPPTTLGLIAMALDKGIDPDKMTQLYDLHERDQKARAVQAYSLAMAEAQAQMPLIVCDQHNKQTDSKYASVEKLNKLIKPVYSRHGFSLSFGEGETKLPGHCRTTCDVKHAGGHAEHFYLDLPLDGVGIKGNANMTAIHGRLSSDTYAQGRLLRKIFNLTVADDDTDDDGNACTVITPDQIGELNDLIEEGQHDLTRFLKWANIERLDLMQASFFAKAKDALIKKARR